MELGNIIFGNSRGEYPVPIEYEKELFRLFGALGDESDHGVNFENGTFSIMPYYWGDCTCGYEEAEYHWDEENEHREDCYQTELDSEAERLGITSGISDEWHQVAKRLCKKYNLPFPDGCAIHCTCDYSERWAVWSEKHWHHPECPIIKPNFLHKPSGLEIQWYKYALRDSYSNQPLANFAEVIDECVESLREGRDDV